MQQNVLATEKNMRNSYFVETKLVTNCVIEIFSMLNTQSTQLVCNTKQVNVETNVKFKCPRICI